MSGDIKEINSLNHYVGLSPLKPEEIIEFEGKKLLRVRKDEQFKLFRYDRVFNHTDGQEVIFDEVSEVV